MSCGVAATPWQCDFGPVAHKDSMSEIQRGDPRRFPSTGFLEQKIFLSQDGGVRKMLVSDQLKPGLEALCWAGEDGRDDSSCRVHAVGGSALEPELTLSKKESWTSLGVVLFFVVLKPCPTALLWTRARARRRVGSWDHLSLQFHSLFGFFSPTREGPCGPVLHRCSGTAVPPHQMADDFERGGPSFPPGEGGCRPF